MKMSKKYILNLQFLSSHHDGRPFGRTAMESAAYGCATIISNKGGLPETFNSDLILKKLIRTFYTIY